MIAARSPSSIGSSKRPGAASRYGNSVRACRAVQRADDLTGPRRHWSDDELEPGFRCEPGRRLHGRRQVGHPRRGQIADGHEPSRARLVDREPVVPAEPDGQVGHVLHRERPLASQRGGDIAVAYIRRALAHRPRLGRRAGGQQRVIAAHDPELSCTSRLARLVVLGERQWLAPTRLDIWLSRIAGTLLPDLAHDYEFSAGSALWPAASWLAVSEYPH